MNNKISVYVLNDFLKFERKLYSLFGINLGRSIQFKTLLYFVGSGVTLLLLSMMPITGSIIKAIPPAVLLFIAVGAAFLLTDVGTENRSPIHFFRSFFRYHFGKAKRHTYYKGKILTAPKPIKFNTVVSVGQEKKKRAKKADGIRFKKGVTIR